MNVRGLKSSESKRKAICHSFVNSNFLCLLDTHLDEESEGNLKKLWKGECKFSHNPTSSQTGGIAFLSKPGHSISEVKKDKLGRFLFLRLNSDSKNFIIACVYAPADKSTKRAEFFDLIHRELRSCVLDNDRVILLGDFNCVEFSLDRSKPLTPDSSVQKLIELRDTFSLVDLWREANPTKVDFTFFPDNPDHSMSRLDRVYVPTELFSNIYSIKHGSSVFSDHRLVTFSHSAISSREKNDSGWVFNSHLLKDPVFAVKFKDFWTSWQSRKSSFRTLAAWWDKGKEKVKALSISYSRQKAKEESKILSSLYKRLRNAENQGKTKLSFHLKSNIRDIVAKKAKSHFLAEKLEWLEGEDKCSKSFLNLHSKAKSETFVHRIVDSKGIPQTTTEGILDVFSSFYKNLFSQHYINEVDQQNFLDGVGMTCLSEDEREDSASELTREELWEALSKLNNGRSPGSDGLTAEFYKAFWDVIGQDLFLVINSSYESGKLTLSQRLATIKCLKKKGDITDVKNWRPLSLLNVDYKILAKALSLRLIKFLPSVISEEQTCSVRGRKIHFNLLTLRDCVEIAEREYLDACLISLDQMKAFDRVSWSFLFKVLHKMNFSKEFISWIKLLYTDVSSTVKINGFLSKRFSVTRGVRQGCPLSPLLYAIFSEVLNVLVNLNSEIKGITVNCEEIKLSQYADDFTAILVGSRSIYAFFEDLEKFERVSGALVNPEKTKALWLGRNVGRTDKPLGLDWTSDFIKILGLPFGNSPNLIQELWTQRISSIRQSLNPWRRSNLSLMGKVVIIKHLIMPVIIYAAIIYPPSQNEINLIEKVFEEFLWDYKRPKIPTIILKLPITKGGLALPDVSLFVNSLALVWVRDIFKPFQCVKWVSLVFYFLNKYRNLRLFKGVFKIYLTKYRIGSTPIPYWYKLLLYSWLQFTQNKRPAAIDPGNLRDEPIFLNPILKNGVSHRPLPTWFSEPRKEPMMVGDLYYDWTPTPMNLPQFNEYHLCNLTNRQFNILKSAVPREWYRKIVGSVNEQELKSFLNVFISTHSGKSVTCVSKLSCQTFYRELTHNLFDLVVSQSKNRKTPLYTEWQNSVGTVVWPKVFSALHFLHYDRKVVQVVFRFLHNSITSREKLYRFGFSDHRLCSRCLLVPESSAKHIFLECSYSKEIWKIAVGLLSLFSPFSASQSSVRSIVVGFADNKVFKDVLKPLEDIRLAFFKAVYTQRNCSLFDHQQIDGRKLFFEALQNTLQTRFDMAERKGEISSFQCFRPICGVEKGVVYVRKI